MRLFLPSEDEDLATAILWQYGTSGIEVRPASNGQLTLLAYFPAGPGLLEELSAAMLCIDGARLETAAVPDVDWVARFREGFRPFTAGGFRIVPSWDAAGPDATPSRRIVVEPGRAFGTGTHETTRLCLAALEELAGRGRLGRTLDVGAGTGILAVASALLGAAPVVATDNDPDAITATRLHARLNHVALHVVRADGGRGLAPRAFDLVLANLTAPLLQERAPEIAERLAPGGRLVLSGLLAEELGAVREAYAFVGPAEVRTQGEWAAVLARAAA